jgi:hypothetical protein
LVGSRTDYPDLATEAARMVMLELVRILGEYKDSMAIVGGWVPELLFANAQPKHVGSIDVDIALDHHTIDADVYRTIREHLARHGYEDGPQPFIFFRTVTVGSRSVKVQVDFLAGEYQGTDKSHRHQNVQTLKARKSMDELGRQMNIPDGGNGYVRPRNGGVSGSVLLVVFKNALYFGNWSLAEGKPLLMLNFLQNGGIQHFECDIFESAAQCATLPIIRKSLLNFSAFPRREPCPFHLRDNCLVAAPAAMIDADKIKFQIPFPVS